MSVPAGGAQRLKRKRDEEAEEAELVAPPSAKRTRLTDEAAQAVRQAMVAQLVPFRLPLKAVVTHPYERLRLAQWVNFFKERCPDATVLARPVAEYLTWTDTLTGEVYHFHSSGLVEAELRRQGLLASADDFLAPLAELRASYAQLQGAGAASVSFGVVGRRLASSAWALAASATGLLGGSFLGARRGAGKTFNTAALVKRADQVMDLVATAKAALAKRGDRTGIYEGLFTSADMKEILNKAGLREIERDAVLCVLHTRGDLDLVPLEDGTYGACTNSRGQQRKSWFGLGSATETEEAQRRQALKNKINLLGAKGSVQLRQMGLRRSLKDAMGKKNWQASAGAKRRVADLVQQLKDVDAKLLNLENLQAKLEDAATHVAIAGVYTESTESLNRQNDLIGGASEIQKVMDDCADASARTSEATELLAQPLQELDADDEAALRAEIAMLERDLESDQQALGVTATQVPAPLPPVTNPPAPVASTPSVTRPVYSVKRGAVRDVPLSEQTLDAA
eukprot:Rhum_TRINITY_DN7719_c0_g2::Rhum_TRINITY_DN7719_c0_g2_i1::g.24427::m.24427